MVVFMKKKLHIGSRIGQLIEYLGYNKSSFSNAIGLTNNVTIGRIVNGEREPSFEILQKITQTFGIVNTEWLLKGEGEMLQGSQVATPATKPQSPTPSCPICLEKEKVIQAQQRTIDILDRELHHSKALYDEEREKGHHDGQKRKVG